MLSLPTFHKPHPPDNCGTCTACCIITPVPEVAKPGYARCEHLATTPAAGCSIYDHRPDRCRKYRCAWHLGLLGNRVDRRPDQSGILFQYEQQSTGRWVLAVYEFLPGAASRDQTRFLWNMLLKHKQMAHLPMENPPVHVYPFGSALPVDFQIAEKYAAAIPSEKGEMKLKPGYLLFTGPTRQIVDPKPHHPADA